MPAETPTRPGQATLGGWLIIAGSVVLILSAWQRISTLHTLEVQEEFQRILAEPPVSGTGLSITTLSTIVRILCMVAAGAATAATVLGFQALKRSTSARIALTCLAPLILVGGFATAGFFAPMVVAGIAMLWLQPTRDWFAGRAWAPRLVPPPRAGKPDPFAPQPPTTSTTPTTPTAPTAPTGQQVAAPQPRQLPPPALHPYGMTNRPAPDRRPTGLIWACVLAWVGTALIAGGLLLVSVVMSVSGDQLFAEFERQRGPIEDLGVSRHDVQVGLYVMTAVVVPWCLVAAILAILAFLGRPWARIALAISSALAGVACLALTIANPLLVVVVAVCAVSTWLLLRSDVAAWRR